MVEAFQMHARQLIDFLTDPDPRDSRASHFTKGPWQLERTPARKQNWERFSQRVMHLSLKRATFTPNERQVETRRIRRDLGADIEQFLDAVDDDRVCKGFLAQARAALLASEPLPDLGALLGRSARLKLWGSTTAALRRTLFDPSSRGAELSR